MLRLAAMRSAMAGAALDLAFFGPADDGIHRTVEIGAEQDGGIARVHLLRAVGASVPGRVVFFGDRQVFLHPLPREGAAVRTGELVVSPPGQPEGPLFDGRAGGERGVRSLRAPGGEMKAGAGHLPGKRGHVGRHRSGSPARADSGPAEDAGFRAGLGCPGLPCGDVFLGSASVGGKGGGRQGIGPGGGARLGIAFTNLLAQLHPEAAESVLSDQHVAFQPGAPERVLA